ncbi:MAG: hypothetical protein ACOC5D_06260 [Thermoplasmatota archaeon]
MVKILMGVEEKKKNKTTEVKLVYLQQMKEDELIDEKYFENNE